MRDFLLLSIFTGLRRGTLEALKWEDVDFVTRVIRISGKTNKSKRDFALPMSDLVHELLVRRRSYGADASGFVFPSTSKSGHVKEPTIAKDNVIASAGVAHFTIHDLRRTYGYVAEEIADVSVDRIKALLDHALPSNDVTRKHYLNSNDPERLRPHSQKVADALKAFYGIEEVQGENVRKLGKA
jgi:integrase